MSFWDEGSNLRAWAADHPHCGHDTGNPQFSTNEHRSVALEVHHSTGHTNALPDNLGAINLSLANMHGALDQGDRHAAEVAFSEARSWLITLCTFTDAHPRARDVTAYTHAGLEHARKRLNPTDRAETGAAQPRRTQAPDSRRSSATADRSAQAMQPLFPGPVKRPGG